MMYVFCFGNERDTDRVKIANDGEFFGHGDGRCANVKLFVILSLLHVGSRSGEDTSEVLFH